MILATQVGGHDAYYFEDEDVTLSRIKPGEPGKVQVVLPTTLRHRELRLAHYHVQAGHPRQARIHNHIRQTFLWPHLAADVATTVPECTPHSENRVSLI